MPRLRVADAEGHGVTGRGETRWMEEAQVDGEGEPADPRSSHRSSWSPRTRRPWAAWVGLVPAGVVWLVCQAEDPGWNLLHVCSLWLVLGGCAHALQRCLRPGRNQRIQQECVTENRTLQNSWEPGSRGLGPRGPRGPLALALADSLLLCVLWEPLSDAGVPHIQALLSRLESVCRALDEADPGSEKVEVDRDSTLTDKVQLICTYLQQRMRSLRALVQAQGEFEAGVKDMLGGLDALWARLEELHAGVTLSKEGRGGHGDLAVARTDAESLLAVLVRYRRRLQRCQTHLRDSTQLLQELTWSHAHVSRGVRGGGGGESVWPELLLQSNIEQFDKVQESFLSLEQQTATFQAHLAGLGTGNQEGRAGDSRSASPRTSPRLHRGSDHVSRERRRSTSASSPDGDAEADAPLTLCERSALQFSSTIGRLRRSGRRK